MAASILHAELISAKFPYNFSELSSTIVLNQGLDIQRGSPRGFQGGEADQQYGIPQAYYMENVIPMARGWTSVAYSQVIPPIPAVGPIINAFEIRGAPAGLAILAVTESAQYIYDAMVQTWTLVTVPTYDPGGTTIANVKGVTYIFIVGSGIFTYNFTDLVLEATVVLGLDVGEIAGIFSAGAQLGAWTDDLRILWSSVINPLDFVPSLSTGAGSTSVLAVTSQIVTVLPIGLDFIIYTATNAVSGRQTGSVQYPFVFDEVKGSTGIAYSYHVAHNTNASVHVTYAASGFQEVTVQKAEYIWTELQEGLAKGIRIKLDVLLERPKIEHTLSVDVRLQFCSNRYISVSVRDRNTGTANTVYTEAFLYDTALNRWGRINADHVCIFEYTIQIIEGLHTYAELDADYVNYNALETVPVPALSYRDIESNPIPAGAKPGSNFALMGIDGKVHLLAPSQTANFRGDNVGITASLPRIFLGRYKVVRDSGIMMHAVKVNKLIAANIVAHGHGIDGSYIRRVENFVENRRQPGHWFQRISADSVTIEFNGSFALTDLSLECESSGTYNPYSAPATKKFYSYINSVIYPLDVTDSLSQQMTFQSASLVTSAYYGYDTANISQQMTLVSASQSETSRTYSTYSEDYISQQMSLQSASQVVTAIYHNVYQEDNISQQMSFQSGSLVTNGIYHSTYPEDYISQRISLISGSLT